jgi:hypothetical protein
MYAMRDVASLAAAARRHADAIGVYADWLLDTDLPWTKMRQACRLPGLVRRYGPGPVDTARHHHPVRPRTAQNLDLCHAQRSPNARLAHHGQGAASRDPTRR